VRRFSFLLLLAFGFAPFSHAVEMRISSAALERTLVDQLFSNDNGRHFLRGNAPSACYAYAEAPKVSFVNDRILVHLHIKARLGTSVAGKCVGIGLSRDVDVSMLPEAEGEIIGFRDARIEKLSGSRELDLLLMPFLSRSVPSNMKVNAADEIRKLLAKSSESIGYEVTLDNMKLHSMIVEGDRLVIDVDGGISVK